MSVCHDFWRVVIVFSIPFLSFHFLLFLLCHYIWIPSNILLVLGNTFTTVAGSRSRFTRQTPGPSLVNTKMKMRLVSALGTSSIWLLQSVKHENIYMCTKAWGHFHRRCFQVFGLGKVSSTQL